MAQHTWNYQPRTGMGMLRVSVCVLRKWAKMVWGRVAGRLGKLGGLCSAGDSKEKQDGLMSLVLF